MEQIIHLFEQLLSMAVIALPVMAVVLLVRLALKKAPKKYSYALWLIVAFRLICPVTIHSPLSVIPQDLPQQIAAEMEMLDDYVGDTKVTFNSGTYQENFQQAVEAGREPYYAGEPGGYYVVTAPDGISPPMTVADSIMPVAAVLWCVGIVMAAIYITLGFLKLKKQVSTAVRRENNIWECEGIPTPFVMGLFRTRIYIPFHLSGEERGYVLEHEQYHIRHLDHWTKALALGILVVYWWNPAVWLCWVLFCRDMEMRCDEAVLAQLGEEVKRGYSLSLVSFALDRRFPAALAFGEHDAAKRVKNVLKWKRTTPIIVVIGTIVVIAVAIVCGTNAVSSSWVRMEKQPAETGGVQVSWNLEDPIQAWALYEDVYEDGTLISSTPRIKDRFTDNGGASERKGSRTLYIQSNYAQNSGFNGTLDCTFGGATWSLELPKDYYSGSGMAFMDAYRNSNAKIHKKHRLDYNDEQVLATVLLSTKETGGITVFSAEEGGIYAENDTVVQYRLVTSNFVNDSFKSMELAMKLHALRTSCDEGIDTIEKIVEAMGVTEDDGLFAMSISGGKQPRLELSFSSKPETDAAWVLPELMLALVDGLEVVELIHPEGGGVVVESTTHHITSADSMGQNYAEDLGFAHIQKVGQSAAGIRALLEAQGWNREEDVLYETARELFSLRADGVREKPAVEQMLKAMNTDAMGSFTVEWLDDATVQVNFNDRAIPRDVLDQEMLPRAAMIMAVGKEIQQLNWCCVPDSNYTVYYDRSKPDVWAQNLEYKDLEDLGRTIEGLRSLMTYLNFDPLTTPPALGANLELAGKGDRWALMEALLQADFWDGPVSQTAHVTTTANFDVTVVFNAAPQDAEALDVAMARRAMVLLKLLPTEINRVHWNYPGENGMENRMLHANEASGIIALSSDTGVYQSIQTAEDFNRFIRFLNLDPKVFLHYAGGENALSLERVDEMNSVWFAPEDIHDIELVVLEWWDGQRFSPLTGEGYDTLLALLATAEQMDFAPGCPFHSVLYLHRADGTVGKIMVAEDSCGAFRSGEDYYTFGTENETLYGVFGTQIEDLPVYTDNADTGSPQEGFTDVLGYSGYIQTNNSGPHQNRIYLTVSGGGVWPIAESFGFGEPQDFSVDLDGDGMKEFVTNVQYGGDGHETVYVYRRVGDGPDGIQKGVLELSDLPNHDDWGVNSTSASYDPETNEFHIRYTQKNTDEYGEVVFKGLDRFTFSTFNKLT